VLERARAFGPFDETMMNEYAEMFYQHTEPQIVDSSAFEQRFGVAPKPLTQGLDETIAWYRDLLAASNG
jgi:nucleoside-diphosphate-sugar epimerase